MRESTEFADVKFNNFPLRPVTRELEGVSCRCKVPHGSTGSAAVANFARSTADVSWEQPRRLWPSDGIGHVFSTEDVSDKHCHSTRFFWKAMQRLALRALLLAALAIAFRLEGLRVKQISWYQKTRHSYHCHTIHSTQHVQCTSI